ncbi:MAG TPA: hypothetical protein VG408_08625, partial [Actinomycetota bacterium]|nr:hypothetical protein [Actinomycetota bacterium]
MSSMHVDIEGERGYRGVAKEQFGVIHREQLRAEGFSSQSIKTRLARHQLIPLLPSTYLVGGAAETWQARLMAAQLWADDCFISHRSAAALWELDGCTGELVEV